MQNKIRILLQEALIVGLLAFMAACTGSTQEEREALDFLYAGMPLPDSVDYPREFWEANVKVALKARHEMPWGERVPGREWRHFVLPLRVNNEDLDSFRIVYYDELKERVKDMTMYSAALEVNHWCHEHVSYQPSDSRTSSPMNTLRSAIGRCGEESTFTVSALRTIGIPARQVYTPRWAHTDDNHAWVEVWVDGRWYFLGACEPEAVLNLGWFNEPASRGMLMHTKVFGDYTGPEEVVSKTPCYTEINVTKNYADVAEVIVTVLSADSLPVEGATVDYRLYNYAELYPIASKKSDERGKSSLTCGKGDLIVWASKDGMFGFRKVSIGKDALASVVLDKDSTYTASFDLDLMPPMGKDNKPEVSVEARRANYQRIAQEDSIRNAYMKQAFCQDCNPDSPEALARANWKTIVAFRGKEQGAGSKSDLLGTLSKKDFRDVTMDVLLDVAEHTPYVDSPLWKDFVLCPRVANERLTPYRGTLSEYFRGMTAEELIQWVKDSIIVDDTRNPQHLCMSPLGVLRHRTCDAHSRDIFFVAAARSIGIPARIDEVTGKVQTRSPQPPLGGETCGWEDASFSSKELPLKGDGGSLRFTYTDQKVRENPSYYSQFALSRINDGRPQLQEFPESATWKDTFADGVQVDAGQYMLISGTRLANGGVWANLNIFNVAAQQQQTEPLCLRADDEHLHVIGNFDCEQYFTNVRGVHKKILDTTGRGFYIVALIRSGHEPSTHLLHDMETSNLYLAQWEHCYLMLFPSQEDYANFDRKEFDDLPSNVLFGIADPETVEALHVEELTHGNQELPIIMLCDTFNRVYWFHQGYSIGLADKLLDVLRKVILKE